MRCSSWKTGPVILQKTIDYNQIIKPNKGELNQYSNVSFKTPPIKTQSIRVVTLC